MDEVIQFWFEEVGPDRHFVKDITLDKEIKDRFEKTYWEILDGTHDSLLKSAEGSLALVIVLDQFARNMFRDTPQAFAEDNLALQFAKKAIDSGFDQVISSEKQRFFYMPFMHSEDSLVHEEAVKLFEALGNELTLKYEIMHKDIIDRFGRYPHRNKILGRESTPEELEFLEQPNSSF